MLILGNSHVSVFEDGILSPGERVEVRWMGALLARHFLDGHPAGRAAVDAIRAEPGWTFLFLGNHDVQGLWRAVGEGAFEAALERQLAEYEAMFNLLAGSGPLAWVASVQQVRNVAQGPVEEAALLRLEAAFRQGLTALCGRLGVAALDPLRPFRAADGRIDAAILQADGLHILQERSGLFLEAFAALSGLDLARNPEPRGRRFRTDHEVGSLAGLLTGRLGLPDRAIPPRQQLAEQIARQAQELLARRGLAADIHADTDLVSSSLLDSLGLVELYAWLHGHLGQSLDFDVDLRAYPTPNDLAERFSKVAHWQPGLEDFVVSLEEPADSAAALEAEDRIAAGGEALFGHLAQVEKETLPEGHGYGIIDYWKSLASGVSARAVYLAACAGSRSFPLPPERLRKRILRLLASVEAPTGDRHDDLTTVQDWLLVWTALAHSQFADLLPGLLRPWREALPDHLDLLLLEARAMKQGKNFAGAHGLLDELESAWPWMADAKLLRGEVFLEEGNPLRAQEYLKAALALDSQAVGTELAIASWNRFCASNRKPAGAVAVPAPAPVPVCEPNAEESPARDLLAQADEAIGRQDFEAAQELLIAALDLDPNLPLIYRALSGLLDAQGDPGMARKILEAGLDQNPEDESLWDSLIDLAEALDPAQAGPDAKDALSRVPTGGGGRWHQRAAETLLEQGHRDAALRVLEEGLRHYPRHALLRAVREAHFPELFKAPSPPNPDQAPRMTVICAVWHKDPNRFALLRDHQACLDAQTVPVDRIYVFDGGDQPPEWIHGKVVATREKLTIYEAWNLALPLVRTPYLMTLNLDDRLNLDCVALYEAALDAGADLTTGDWRITFSQEETNRLELSFPAKELPLVRDRMWPPPPHEPARLGSAGENWSLGPAYAWKMKLHLEFPRFPWMFGDRSLIRTIGDAVWGKLLEGAGKKIVRLPKVVGHYYSHPGEQAEFRNPANTETETINRVGIAFM